MTCSKVFDLCPNHTLGTCVNFYAFMSKKLLSLKVVKGVSYNVRTYWDFPKQVIKKNIVPILNTRSYYEWILIKSIWQVILIVLVLQCIVYNR